MDLVFDRADDVLTLCEMKYSRNPIGVDVIPEVEGKVALLRDVAGGRTIQPILIIHGGATKDLVDSGYYSRIIDAPAVFLNPKRRR